MKEKSKEKFVRLRYGLFDDGHWTDMTDGERILFVTLLRYTHWRGKLKGWCMKSDAEIAAFLKWGQRKCWVYKKKLCKRGFIIVYNGKRGVFIPKYDLSPTSPGAKVARQSQNNLRHPRRSTYVTHDVAPTSPGAKVVCESPKDSEQLQPPKTVLDCSRCESNTELDCSSRSKRQPREKPLTPPPGSDIDSQSEDQKQTMTRSEGARQVLDALDESKRKRKKEEADHAEDVPEL